MSATVVVSDTRLENLEKAGNCETVREVRKHNESQVREN